MLALHYIWFLYYWDMIIIIIIVNLYNVDHIFIDLDRKDLNVMLCCRPSIP